LVGYWRVWPLRAAAPGRAASNPAWQLLIGTLGMPELAGVAEADGLAVFDDVGNDENFRMPG
jgi:hypothetical protein